MFPVLTHVEMAGVKGANPVATAVAEDRARRCLGACWPTGLRAIPAYAAAFAAAFADVDAPG